MASPRAPELVGRAALLDRLAREVVAGGLQTLTGPGGVGKTSIARQLAGRLAASHAFADGVCWVDLAALGDGALVSQVVAGALGVVELPGRSWTETLVDALRPAHTLLVLDTCEHLGDACAALCAQLLAACPRVQILATSRAPLGLNAEGRHVIPPLDALASAELFVLRATERLPAFVLDERTEAYVATICARLDGMPLALELAAARIGLLSVAQIAERLEHSLNLLVARNSSASPRHRSLRAVLDWSYGLLSADAQALFRQLAVFAASFDLDAVEVVCFRPGALDALAELVDRSLVTVVAPGEPAVRYRLHTVVGQYAAERLDESGGREQVSDRLLAWAISLAARAERRLKDAGPDAGIAELVLEHENIRAALQRATQAGDAEGLLGLAGALGPLWNSASMAEGRSWLARGRALAGQPVSAPVSVKAWNCASFLAYRQGDYDAMFSAATTALGEALASEDGEGIAAAAYRLGIHSEMKGETAQARAYYRQSLALYQELGDRRGANHTLNGLAHVAALEGNPAEAEDYYRQGLALARAAGDRLTTALLLISQGNLRLNGDTVEGAAALYAESLVHLRAAGNRSYLPYVVNGLGEVAFLRGDFVGATAHYEEGLRLARELGLQDMEAQFLAHLGRSATARRAFPEAAQALSEALRRYLALGRPTRTGGMLHWCAELLVALGHHTQATTLIAAGLRVAGVEEFAYLGSEGAQALARAQTVARDCLDPATYALALADGAALTLPQAAELALAAVWLPPAPPATPPPSLRIFAFGRLRVVRDGRELTGRDWVYGKTRDLLLLLLQVASANKAEIGAALWPDASPGQLRQSFRVAIYHLRRALGGAAWISFETGRYAFNPAGAWVDLAAFENALERAGDEPMQRLAQLRVAAALYTGDLDPGELYGDEPQLRRERLRHQALTGLIELGTLYEAAGEHGAATHAYRRTTELDSYGEAAHRGLLRSLARQGDSGAALDQYQRLVELLNQELGAAPAAETTALAERIRAGEVV